MALCVFLLSMFLSLLIILVFFLLVFFLFFMSGYGMEKSNKRDLALKKVGSLGYFCLVFLDLFYFFVFSGCGLILLPWFLVVYFAVMLIYRFISNVYGLLWAFVLLACVFYCLGFEFGWSASFGGFLFGVFFARNPRVL